MKGYIYAITHESGKTYIGQTIQEPKTRWRKHFNNKKNQLLPNALHKYGREAFSYEVIAEYSHDERDVLHNILNKAEVYYIDVYDSFNSGFNMTSGGEAHKSFSKETLKKMRKPKKNRTNTLKGRTGILSNAYKTKRTDEQKKRYSNCKKGNLHPISRSVIYNKTGVVYGSMRLAEEVTGVDRRRIKKSCDGNLMRNQLNSWSWVIVC